MFINWNRNTTTSSKSNKVLSAIDWCEAVCLTISWYQRFTSGLFWFERTASSRSTSVQYTKCLRSHVVVIDMLVEGRINQPPFTPSESEWCFPADADVHPTTQIEAPPDRTRREGNANLSNTAGKAITSVPDHNHLKSPNICHLKSIDSQHLHHHHHHYSHHSHESRRSVKWSPSVRFFICTFCIIFLLLIVGFIWFEHSPEVNVSYQHPKFELTEFLIPISSIILILVYYLLEVLSPTSTASFIVTKYLSSLRTILASVSNSSLASGTKKKRNISVFTQAKRRGLIKLAAMLLTALIGFDIISPTMSDSSILVDLQRKHSVNSFDSSTTNTHRSSHLSSSQTNHKRKLVEEHERHFLNILGLNEKPRPPKDHKVHPRMLDFYRLIVGRQLEIEADKAYLLEQGENAFEQTPNSVMISSDDFSDASQLLDEPFDESDDEELEKNYIARLESSREEFEPHHRVPRVRRQTLAPRFTLRGQVNTMASHPLSTRKLDKINHRIKRSASPGEIRRNVGDDYLHNEAHLRFDVDLKPGEYLQGAELQLYRHSLYDVYGEKTTSLSNHLAEHNNFWPLYQKKIKATETGERSKEQEVLSNNLLRVNLYRLMVPLEKSHLNDSNGSSLWPILKLVDSQVIDVRSSSAFLSFDVMPAVEHWTRNFGSNHGLYVTLLDLKGRKSPHSNSVVLNPEDSQVQSNPRSETFHSETSDWPELRPHLFTYTSDRQEEQSARPVRVKRNTREDGHRSSSGFHSNKQQTSKTSRQRRKHHKSKPRNSAAYRQYCKRYKLYFDFKEMGWSDWVIAPPGIQAFQCGGECAFPMPSQLNATNHAIIQALVNSKNTNVVPAPCCVPTDLSPITLLYSDNEEKMVVKNYQEMVVEGCGCA